MTRTERQDLMRRAHELAATYEGDYRARMALGLRKAWLERKLTSIGSEWENYGKHRIYFNDLAELYGLECDYYKTGNVQTAWLDGKHVSNNQARGLLWSLKTGKLYYDYADGQFHGRDLNEQDIARLIARLQEAA